VPSLTVRPFSNLKQVPFVPRDGSGNEEFASERTVFSGGLIVDRYSVLHGVQDVSISNDSLLAVTPTIDAGNVFKTDKGLDYSILDLKRFGLKVSSGESVTVLDDKVYVGGVGDPLFVVPVPSVGSTVLLKPDPDSFLEVSKQYPYEINITKGPVAQSELYKRQFHVEYSNSSIVIRTITQEGPRYVAPCIDRRVRATGLVLVDTVLNDYYFDPVFDTSVKFALDADFSIKEVKYFNSFESNTKSRSAELRVINQKDTGVLVSVPISTALKQEKAPTDVAILKTNFSPTGSYSVD
jgi:hypothetical protein